MALTKEDISLRNCLSSKIDSFKSMIAEGRPYVWALRLSLSEFEALENAIKKSVNSHSGDHKHLICDDFAPSLVVYYAEWYKRYYKGADVADEHKTVVLNSVELEKLFDLAHIDKKTFVYNASKNPDKTSFRWLESLQVLGGLAIQAELKRDEETDTLLKSLCKIFHGEDLDLNDLNDRNRAVAFQQSIKRQHSLYEYLDCILDKRKDYPFAKSDITDKNSDVHLLIDKILEADRGAKKDKFDFEWIVSYSPSHSQMVRRLKVKLKPELIGGGLKQYIGYDRMKSTWDIEHPEEIGRLSFSIRFKNGGHCVQEASFAEPLFQYHNTGHEKTGFSAINMIDEAVCTDVPIKRFDTVELAMKYNDVIKTVQTLEVKDYIQLYKLAKTTNEWSSRRNAQAPTAVVFSSAYRLADEYSGLPVVFAHFRNHEDCGEDFCWCVINDKVVLVDHDGNEVLPPFFNRNGLYQVVTKRYLDTIKYQENLYAIYEYKDLDEDDDELLTDTMPVLFGRDGLMVLHFASGASREGNPIASYDLEWQQTNGRYIDWNNTQPEQGPVRLRITVKGIVFNYKVYYVPFSSTEAAPAPIWRDFEHTRICTAIEGVKDIQDEFKRELANKEPDTKRLKIGPDNSHILVDVYRPVILRELSQKGTTDNESRIISYGGKDEDIHLPLINCEQFSIRDFSEKGVREYQFKSHSEVYYSFPTFDRPGMAETVYTQEIPASKLSLDIPLSYLKIYISRAMDNPTGLYAWDYKGAPEPVTNLNSLQGDGIVFQSLKDNDSPRDYCMPKIKKATGGWGGKKASVTISALDCFETVSEHKVYYFLFEPLVKSVSSGTVISDILLPLMRKRGYCLSDKDRNELYRFAVEFHFDWMLINRESWLLQINNFSGSEDENNNLKEAVIDFFSRTPKSSDEREVASLAEFLKIYWDFNSYPKVEPVVDKALKLILGREDAIHNFVMNDFLKEYDCCRFKFIEMSKAIVNTEL